MDAVEPAAPTAPLAPNRDARRRNSARSAVSHRPVLLGAIVSLQVSQLQFTRVGYARSCALYLVPEPPRADFVGDGRLCGDGLDTYIA